MSRISYSNSPSRSNRQYAVFAGSTPETSKNGQDISASYLVPIYTRRIESYGAARSLHAEVTAAK
eukprot:3283247-Amphidinium_carterae.1